MFYIIYFDCSMCESEEEPKMKFSAITEYICHSTLTVLFRPKVTTIRPYNFSVLDRLSFRDGTSCKRSDDSFIHRTAGVGRRGFMRQEE